MTGFGQAEAENERLRVAVTVRTVNHRFLDLVVRLGEDYRELETPLRGLLDRRLTRGRVDLRVAIETLSAGETTVVVDRELAAAVLAAAAELAAAGASGEPLRASDLLGLPEVMRVERERFALAAADRELVLTTAERAVDQLIAMRETEGQQMASFLGTRLETLAGLTGSLSEAREQVRNRLLGRMRQRVEELLAGQEMTADRLAQETALLAEKIDVQEELDRLAAHLESFGAALAGDSAVGRRLDFLAQEIHRELNTLGAKCRDAGMADWVIDGKLVCEQLREQVQNVE